MFDFKAFKGNLTFPPLNKEVKHQFNLSGNTFEFKSPAINVEFDQTGLKIIKSPINIYEKQNYFLKKRNLSYLMFFRTGWEIPYSVFSKDTAGSYELTFNIVKTALPINLFEPIHWEKTTQEILINKGTSVTKGIKNIKLWQEFYLNHSRWLKVVINNVDGKPHRVIFTSPISDRHLITLNFEAPKSIIIEEKNLPIEKYFNAAVNDILSTLKLELTDQSKKELSLHSNERFTESIQELDWLFLNESSQ